MHVRILRAAVLCVLLSNASCSQAQSRRDAAVEVDANATVARQHWVDSVYNRLSEDERVGQLFMVAAYSGGPKENSAEMERMIHAHQIGGLIFMQGTAEKQAVLTNKFQHMAQVPLLLAMDAEWGLGMRLEGVKNLPRQMMIGATRNEQLAHQLGAIIAAQCKRLGVHIDFAPDVDVNNNPNNPIINTRSFGEQKSWVAKLGIAYMNGLQEKGVMACAKHFPGHGDVSVDSHKDLPVINKTRAQLDTLEFYPFKELIHAGVKSMMIAHLSVPSLEPGLHVPTTLSKNTVTNVLRHDLGFQGLIFTDALNMQGVAKYFAAGEADVKAFEAGCDVLLFSQDVPMAISKIKSAVKEGRVTPQDLEQRVKKILAAKWDAGLSTITDVQVANATADINQQVATFNALAAEEAFTVARNNDHLFPLAQNAKVIFWDINGSMDKEAIALLKRHFTNCEIVKISSGQTFTVPPVPTDGPKPVVVICAHVPSFNPGSNYGLDASTISFLKRAASYPQTIVAIMGNAYAIKYACDANTILCGYEDNEWTNAALVKALTGVLKPKGVLPVTPPCLK